jgi:hypothetical protein
MDENGSALPPAPVVPPAQHISTGVHHWKLRKEGFRDLVLGKGWALKGTYAEKKIRGQLVAQWIVEKSEDHVVCVFTRRS